MSLVIKNIQAFVDNKKKASVVDVLIQRGKIQQIGSKISSKAAKAINGSGKFLFPGLIDLQAHIGEPGYEDRETIQSVSEAATRGGFTTIVAKPDTNPTLDQRALVEMVYREGQRIGLCNLMCAGALTKKLAGKELSDMYDLVQAGCKVLSNGGKSFEDLKIKRLAIEYAKMFSAQVMLSCEQPALTNSAQMNESFYSTVIGVKGCPEISESIEVFTLIEMARYLDVPIHIVNVTTARSVELIREAKKEKIPITANTAVHYLVFNEEDLTGLNPLLKVKPPLRSRMDQEVLINAVKEGVIDCLISDHMPLTPEDKEIEFDQASFGMSTLETAWSAAVNTLIHSKKMTWWDLLQRFVVQPAKVLDLPEKGQISEGYDADLFIYDADQLWKFDSHGMSSTGKNTPFQQYSFHGKILTTLFKGKIVYQV